MTDLLSDYRFWFAVGASAQIALNLHFVCIFFSIRTDHKHLYEHTLRLAARVELLEKSDDPD